jgi:F0F1-type ATP synthase membrane subunit c/vacuolar-type H+-ATPase subunit K
VTETGSSGPNKLLWKGYALAVAGLGAAVGGGDAWLTAAVCENDCVSSGARTWLAVIAVLGVVAVVAGLVIVVVASIRGPR